MVIIILIIVVQSLSDWINVTALNHCSVPLPIGNGLLLLRLENLCIVNLVNPHNCVEVAMEYTSFYANPQNFGLTHPPNGHPNEHIEQTYNSISPPVSLWTMFFILFFVVDNNTSNTICR